MHQTSQYPEKKPRTSLQTYMIGTVRNPVRNSDKLVLRWEFNARVRNEVIFNVNQIFNEPIIIETEEFLIDFSKNKHVHCSRAIISISILSTTEETKNTWFTWLWLTSREIHPTEVLDVGVLKSSNVGIIRPLRMIAK